MSQSNWIKTLVATAFLWQLPTFTYAQEATQASEQESAQESAADAEQAPQPAISSGETLRLQDTIRGNKEQPQVLTIVPWQLPSHQRINENRAWQPVVESLPSIERGQFLRDLSVVDEIIGINQQGSAEQSTSTTNASQ